MAPAHRGLESWRRTQLAWIFGDRHVMVQWVVPVIFLIPFCVTLWLYPEHLRSNWVLAGMALFLLVLLVGAGFLT